MPESSSLHVDQLLTNFSVKYRNEEYIWRDVLPTVNVMKRSDKYATYTKADTYRVADDALGENAMPNEVDFSVGSDNYSVNDHGLGGYVSQESIDNQDTPYSVETDKVDHLNNLLDLAQENRVAALVFAAATYPTGNKVQLSGTAQWSGSADAPITNVQTAVETCFMRANTLVFGLDAWLVFRRLPEVVEAVRAINPSTGSAIQSGFVSRQGVADLFEVDRVLVGRARKNTAKQGQTASYARVWGKHMAALHLSPTSLGSISFGKTFVESDKVTYREFDGKRGVKGSHYMKVAWNSDEKIVASDLGYFIEDAVA